MVPIRWLDKNIFFVLNYPHKRNSKTIYLVIKLYIIILKYLYQGKKAYDYKHPSRVPSRDRFYLDMCIY